MSWFYIFCIASACSGVVLFLYACLLEDAQIKKNRLRGFPAEWIGQAGIFLVVLGAVFALGGPANAQVVMWPGQELRFCNGIGAISGGGTVCVHDIVEQRIEMTFKNSAWHRTFWGDGTAASLLPPLCRIANVHQVTETVFEPGLVRTRTIPCSTGKSGPWIVYEVPES